jgi:hypothetical protein
MAYKIQQLGLGGILDQSFAIVKDHFGLLFKIMLFVLIPFSLIGGLGMNSLLPNANTMFPTPEQQQQTAEAMARYWPVIAVVSLLQMLVILPITNAAVIQAVAHLYLGKPIDAMTAVKDGIRLLPPLLGTLILYYLAMFGGFILLFIPGLIIAVLFALCQHVVVIEGTSGPAALGRSRRLLRGQIGTFIALGFILGIISWFLSVGPSFIPQPHARVIVTTLVQACTTIIWTAALVVFYFSCRCANESFDLQYLANAIGEQPSAEAIAEDAAAPRI